MINVYKLENSKDRVLLDIDVNVFMMLMAAWGESRPGANKNMIVSWGFTREEAERAQSATSVFQNNTSLYQELKETAIELYKEYLEERYHV